MRVIDKLKLHETDERWETWKGFKLDRRLHSAHLIPLVISRAKLGLGSIGENELPRQPQASFHRASATRTFNSGFWGAWNTTSRSFRVLQANCIQITSKHPSNFRSLLPTRHSCRSEACNALQERDQERELACK
jgi:hypothetical protein